MSRKPRTLSWQAGSNLWIKVECANEAESAKLQAMLRRCTLWSRADLAIAAPEELRELESLLEQSDE